MAYDPESDRRWRKKNPKRANYLRARSAARSFIRRYATEEDMQELEEIIEEKRENLQNNT